MSLAGLKKQFDKANQLISEKLGGTKGTDLDEDYLKKEKIIDHYKSLFDEMLLKTIEYLQPNPNHRTKLMAAKAFHKIAGKEGGKPLYPQVEGQIADLFNQYGKEAGANSFGESLIEVGEAFKELEDHKYALEDTLMKDYITPISKLRNNDIKEISLLRKKVQSRRLTFDALKRNKDKGSKVTDDELKESENKFMEAKDLAFDAMTNFLNSEGEHISIIASFIKAERDYHHHTADIFESLFSNLLKKRDAANSNKSATSSKSSTICTKTKKLNSEDSTSLQSQPGSASYDQNQPYVFKKGYDTSSSVPTCRALYDFNAETTNELPFSEGDVIKLIQQVDENWFEGELKGKTGFFPINFVEVLVPLKD